MAFVLFYRLIARLGTTRTVVVTFLIPVFGMTWGGLFLGERVTTSMVFSTVLILFGTALSQGMWRRRDGYRRPRSRAATMLPPHDGAPQRQGVGSSRKEKP